MVKNLVSLLLGLCMFGLVLLIRGPDTLALLEAVGVCVAIILGLATDEDLRRGQFYENEYVHWRERAEQAEEAIADFVKHGGLE